MSLIVQFIDPNMLRVDNLYYASALCIAVQRTSVLLSESVLYYSLYRWTEGNKSQNVWMVVVAVVFNAGLLMVDHIHFQYNGFLLGVLLLSIVEMKQRPLMAALYFSILLHLKHIYLYIAPVYVVYLLRTFVYKDRVGWLSRLLQLAGVVVGVTLLSFGPFVWNGTITQLIGRLFPFKRGLCHAYWAANMWALYAALDRGLSLVFKVLRLPIVPAPSMTRGIVGDVAFAVLPNVPPWMTFVLTLLSIIPTLVHLWRKPSFVNFQASLILCAFGSFLFGWHVHEKAVLLITMPLSLLIHQHAEYYRAFVFVSAAGHYALFPLLYNMQEVPLRIALLLVWMAVVYPYFYRVHQSKAELFSKIEWTYLIGFLPLEVYHVVGHALVFGQALPFLPLLLISVYSAVGILYAWVLLYRHHLLSN